LKIKANGTSIRMIKQGSNPVQTSEFSRSMSRKTIVSWMILMDWCVVRCDS